MPARRWPGVACALLALLLHAPRAGAGEDGLDLVKRGIRARFGEVPQLGTDTLRTWLTDATRPPPLLLDVRTREEFGVSHLAGAERAESAAEAMRVLAAAPRDTPIVAYCSVGYRSSALVRELLSRGYVNANNLEGSIFEWANRGFPVERDGRVVREVHPYGWPWNRYLARELHWRGRQPAGR